MIRFLKQSFTKWRYLGYNQETVVQHRVETDRSNLRSLRHLCLFSLTIVIFLSFYYYLVPKYSLGAFLCAVNGLLLVALWVAATRMLNTVKSEIVRGTNALICITSSVAYVLSILSGTLLSRGDLGVVAVWMFLLVQISFDIPPLQNALTVLPALGVFLVTSHAFKPLEKWPYDAAYSVVSVAVGLFLSHHQTRLALDNIIARSQLIEANYNLYHTCTTDDLTGLSNRRMVFDVYDNIVGYCAEKKTRIACVVLDVDDYKHFNDTYGHPEGDEMLRRIGETLRAFSQQHGIDVGRIGGEEFLAVWPEQSAERCERMAEALRGAIEQMAIPQEIEKACCVVTISVGLCLLPPELAQSAYLYADKALYRAKDAGKNRSCRYDAETGDYFVLPREQRGT